MKMKLKTSAKSKGDSTPESGSENSVVVESEEEQLVYSWHKVNVFTTLKSVQGLRLVQEEDQGVEREAHFEGR
ncbi:hypothetical protein O3P69_006913 [Scylla paramamosain]|uniref:Uncharacterized protein n=1 Tax=Scylla paramamosain TaxID=85552 RepID=A0AAW0U1I3_SCYPA